MGIDYKKIQLLVAAIPRGKVATYGQIAMWAGCPRNARVVVWAMRAASPQMKLPYHRVVNRTGRLAPNAVFNGKDRQREILENEGIPFTRDGRIDLQQCLWDIPDDE